uniref:Uncharacterized protein n=1 Tax=Lygus hesperus TaxID=30085 RepID=A0A146KRR9_LYGHE
MKMIMEKGHSEVNEINSDSGESDDEDDGTTTLQNSVGRNTIASKSITNSRNVSHLVLLHPNPIYSPKYTYTSELHGDDSTSTTVAGTCGANNDTNNDKDGALDVTTFPLQQHSTDSATGEGATDAVVHPSQFLSHKYTLTQPIKSHPHLCSKHLYGGGTTTATMQTQSMSILPPILEIDATAAPPPPATPAANHDGTTTAVPSNTQIAIADGTPSVNSFPNRCASVPIAYSVPSGRSAPNTFNDSLEFHNTPSNHSLPQLTLPPSSVGDINTTTDCGAGGGGNSNTPAASAQQPNTPRT